MFKETPPRLPQPFDGGMGGNIWGSLRDEAPHYFSLVANMGFHCNFCYQSQVQFKLTNYSCSYVNNVWALVSLLLVYCLHFVVTVVSQAAYAHTTTTHMWTSSRCTMNAIAMT